MKIRSVLLMICLLNVAAIAQPVEATYELDIAAQPLKDALKAFAQQSGLQVVFFTKITEGHQSPPVKGRLTGEEALNTLLKGTALKFRKVNSKTIAVDSSNPAERGSAGVDASSGEIVLAQVEPPSAGANVASTAPVGTGNAIIIGRLTDANSGTALPGALVRLVQNGETTRTDDGGYFRFNGLAAGDYSISTSYLGYADRVWPARAGTDTQVSQYQMSNIDTEVAEVTVYGTRSSRALALNQQRTADNNSEVISSDMLGDFTGTTISEALRHVSGVSFIQDYRNGSGANIIVRGLEPDMNAVKLNGVNVPMGNGQDRSASLNNLLADTVSKIVINKSLLPSMDSSGTGALVEIETRSPLDRPERYFNLSAEGSRRGGNFEDDYLVSGTGSRTFGESRNMGLSISAQYRKETNRTVGYNANLAFGPYLPLGPGGQPNIPSYLLDPRLEFPYEALPGAGDVFVTGGSFNDSRYDTSTLALTGGWAWRITDNADLKLDVQHSVSNVGSYQAQANQMMNSNYILRPVAALGGEVRQALTFEGNSAFQNQMYQLDQRDSVTDTYSLRGSALPGKWTVNYMAGYAHGADSVPHRSMLNLGSSSGGFGSAPLDPSFFLPEATDPVEGLIITPYPRRSGKGMPVPLFSAAGWEYFNNADNYYFNGGSLSGNTGRNDRYTGELSGRRDLDWGPLRYLEFGGAYERAEFQARFYSTNINAHSETVFLPDPPFFQTTYPSISSLGLAFVPSDLARIGHSGAGFDYLDEAGVQNFFARLNDFAADGSVIDSIEEVAQNPLANDQYTREGTTSAYAQAKFQFGKLEVVGGARLSSVKVDAVALYGPRLIDVNFVEDLQFAQDFSRLQHLSDTVTEILPRVALNYRQTDNLIFRGSYHITTARPSVAQLGSGDLITLYQAPFGGPNNNQPSLQISRSNPGLKPAITDNFDLNAEYYDSHVGVIKVGGFYKRIKNLLQANTVVNVQDISDVELPDYPAFQNLDNVYITSSQPVNSPYTATIWGAEAHVERQFSFLPGEWSGLGMYANYAYSHSSSHQSEIYQAPVFDDQGNVTSFQPQVLEFSGVPFNTQPSYSGTAALTYAGHGVDASLGYSFQDSYQSFFNLSALHYYNAGVKTLDLRASYYFNFNGMKWRAVFEGTDLLKSRYDTDVATFRVGDSGPEYYNTANYLGGRAFRLGLSTTF